MITDVQRMFTLFHHHAHVPLLFITIQLFCVYIWIHNTFVYLLKTIKQTFVLFIFNKPWLLKITTFHKTYVTYLLFASSNEARTIYRVTLVVTLYVDCPYTKLHVSILIFLDGIVPTYQRLRADGMSKITRFSKGHEM